MPSPREADRAEFVQLVAAEEACRRLGGIDRATLDLEVAEGRLVPTRIRSRVMFSLTELARYIAACTTREPRSNRGKRKRQTYTSN
ncbi:MAG TPA: hypothetical protein VGO93_28630 [Candidatus Xenobia bacterium]